MANIWGTIGKKSIKAIGGMTKAEIEAAKEAERAAAQASWDRVAGMEPAREKTGLRYSPAIGPELAGKQYAKDTAKFPGMAGFDPYEPRAIFDAQSASGLPVEIIRNPTRDDLLRMTAPSRDPNSASFRGSMSEALARYMTDDKGNRYAFSASDLVHQEAADALRGHGVPLKSYGGEGMAQDDNGVVRRFGDELTPSGVMSAKDLFRWRYGIPAGIGAATGAAVLGSPQDADAAPIEPIAKGIRAYHGSPHLFDKFDISKIGTGEGAQSYGHGLYFGGNEGVARHYRDVLAPSAASTLRFSGVVGDDPVEVAARAINMYGERGAENALKMKGSSTAKAAIKLLRSGDPRVEARSAELIRSPGHMYEVNLDVDPNSLLDWDRPLSEQPRGVQDATFGLFPSSAMHDARFTTSQPGKFFHDELAFGSGRSIPYGTDRSRVLPKESASERFRDAGIPGIQYLDQGSRAAGDGTRNYVMFDDKPISILRRYGMTAPIAAEHMSAAPTRGDELNDLIGPAFDKLAGGDYLGAGFALGQSVPEYLKRRQGDPQAVAADAFELWDPTGLASIPLQWWDQNKYNEDVVRRPDFSSDGGGPEVARYKKRAIFAKGRK